MRKLTSLLLALLAALTLLSPASARAAEKSSDLVVLYTNDVHCQVDQAKDKTGTTVTNIGYAGVVSLKKSLQEDYNDVLLVDAGDHMQGSAIGSLSKGAYLADIMNQAGYDYAAIGNHEFDFGMNQLFTNIRSARYQYLSCNFARTDGTAIDGVKAYDIKEYNGTKVAFIGISTPESFTKSTPTYFQDSSGNYIYTFAEGGNGRELYDKVQSTIDAAKADGAEYIIALSHLGTDPGSSPWTSKDVIANTSGLNVVLDGHSHNTIPSESVTGKDGASVLLSSTGTKLAAVGRLVVNLDSKTADSSLVTGYAAQDDDTLAAIADIESEYSDLLRTVVARSEVTLTTKTADGSKRAVRNAETNLGDLCADAYRTQLNADIAFANGGGIRADIAAGDITYGQIINVHPYGNMICMVEATGQQIVDALEMSSRNYPDENGGFLQVSGLTYNINPSVKSTVEVDSKGMFISAGSDRRVENVKVLDRNSGQYVPVDLNKTYKLVSNNYMLKSGGDGLNMFMKDKILEDEVELDSQVLIDYIKDSLNGAVGAGYADLTGQRRITVCEHANGTKIVNQKDASCAEEGYTGDAVCADCGMVMTTGLTLPAAGKHNYVDGVCTVCGATTNYQVYADNITQTKYTLGTDETVALHIDGDLAKLTGIKVDTVMLSPDCYISTAGSTIITFEQAYLNTLSAGDHDVQVIFTDGTAHATLTVYPESAAGSTATASTAALTASPSTGDGSCAAVYAALCFAALLGIGITAGKKQERM